MSKNFPIGGQSNDRCCLGWNTFAIGEASVNRRCKLTSGANDLVKMHPSEIHLEKFYLQIKGNNSTD